MRSYGGGSGQAHPVQRRVNYFEYWRRWSGEDQALYVFGCAIGTAAWLAAVAATLADLHAAWRRSKASADALTDGLLDSECGSGSGGLAGVCCASHDAPATQLDSQLAAQPGSRRKVAWAEAVGRRRSWLLRWPRAPWAHVQLPA